LPWRLGWRTCPRNAAGKPATSYQLPATSYQLPATKTPIEKNVPFFIIISPPFINFPLNVQNVVCEVTVENMWVGRFDSRQTRARRNSESREYCVTAKFLTATAGPLDECLYP
jgi:hypothetical protein